MYSVFAGGQFGRIAVAAASVYGYRELCCMDNLGYIESMTVRDALHGEPKKVEKRRR